MATTKSLRQARKANVTAMMRCLALVTAAVSVAVVGLASSPVLADTLPSNGGKVLGTVDLSDNGDGTTTVFIQMLADYASSTYSAEIYRPAAPDGRGRWLLSPVVNGASKTVVLISAKDFASNDFTIVLSGSDGSVVGTAGISGWSGNGIGRWSIQGA